MSPPFFFLEEPFVNHEVYLCPLGQIMALWAGPTPGPSSLQMLVV